MIKILKMLRMRWKKTYVSPVDLFHKEFDARHKKSASQEAEIKKYRKIYALRDKATRS